MYNMYKTNNNKIYLYITYIYTIYNLKEIIEYI